MTDTITRGDTVNGTRRKVALITLAISGLLIAQIRTAALGPSAGLANDATVGVVIVSFDSPGGLTPANFDVLRSADVMSGVTFCRLGIFGAFPIAGPLTMQSGAPQNFHIDSDPTVGGPGSATSRPFTAEPSVNLLGAFDGRLVGEPGATNLVGICLRAPDGTSNSPTFAARSEGNISRVLNHRKTCEEFWLKS